MRYDGPTMALHADNNFGGLSELANIPMSAPRYMNRSAPPMLPPQMKNAFTPSGLSLGLPNCPDLLQLEPKTGAVLPEGGDILLKPKAKEDENESRSGSGSENMGNVSGDEQGPPRKKRYHRHTTKQIQEMESLFKECPHPDDKQRQELSRELGLEPRQVKFWFQNRRTQMKAQQERAENSMLRAEIERLRVLATNLRNTLRSATCPSCGGPATFRDSLDEQHLRATNSLLKDEIQRVECGGYFRIPPIPAPLFTSSPPSLMGMQTPSLLEDSSKDPSISEVDRSNFLDMAMLAMEEFMQLCQPDSRVWIRTADGTSVLNCEEYMRQFPKNNKQNGLKTDASRAEEVVMVNATSLVEIFMSPDKWTEMFPIAISKACACDISPNNGSGAMLQLIQAELHVLSPLIKTREVSFLRYCKQLTDCTWAIVDVSPDGYGDVRCRRRPSGFFIEELLDGRSKIVAVEHMEYDDSSTHQLVRSLVSSGAAFGARRWLATLQRQCESLCSFLPNYSSMRDIGAISSNYPGRQGLLKLSQKMTNSFCASVGSSSGSMWSPLVNNEAAAHDIRVMSRKNMDNPAEPHGVVLSAVTTIWLAASPQRVFDYIRCEHIRNEWDITSGAMVQEAARIGKTQHPGNDVSLFSIQCMNSPNSNSNNVLILQESSTDASGSLVVYAPVEVSAINLVIQDGDPVHVPVLPSGFVILPDGAPAMQLEGDTATPAASRVGGGTLLTVAVQILINDLPKMSIESINAISTLISSNVLRVKSALSEGNEL